MKVPIPNARLIVYATTDELQDDLVAKDTHLIDRLTVCTMVGPASVNSKARQPHQLLDEHAKEDVVGTAIPMCGVTSRAGVGRAIPMCGITSRGGVGRRRRHL